MDYGHLLRRGFHLCAPVFLVYYLMPEDFLGIGRDNILLTAFAGLMAFEIIRLATGKVFVGLREYEKGRLSAYAWAAIGITLGFLFFPMMFVVPAVWGIGWVDPLIGEMRKSHKRERKRRKHKRRKRKMKGYPHIPLAVYFLITFTCIYFLSEISLPVIILIAAVASVVAIAVEKPSHKHIDDDFLMLFVPLLAMHLLYATINYLA